jgi:hypothetical protein
MRGVGRFGLALTGLGVVLAVLPGTPSAHGAAGPPATAPAAAAGSYARTQTVSRDVLGATGAPDASLSSSYRMTVRADRTTDLRGRERIGITWSGARPSAGRASNPYGEKGLLQEYPVVILQCRGTDDADLPLDRQVRPETCWTSSVAQRSQRLASRSESTWLADRYADPADRQPVSGMDPFPTNDCPSLDTTVANSHLTEFVTQAGRTYAACSAEKMPPEAAIDAAFPPSEIAAYTDLDGKGSVKFEVRSDVENESLGCSHEVACSIVVIPILGISCDTPSSPMTSTERACRKTGRFQAGSSNFADEGVDQAVSPALWWAASNWRNRFSIPVTFGLPSGVCDVLDPRAPTKFFGSELMAQAALQWAPAYCLRKDRFNFALSQMPDSAGWDNMENGSGPAAFVSSEHPRQGADPVGYAPTAVTGFSVGYTIDRPDNGGEYGNLRLNPRLLAKLLTQSYLGSDLGRGHPGIGSNPLGIMADPEFVRLNPGLSQNAQEVGATLLSLSVSSDLIHQITSYIAQDVDAMAFMAGEPDPWGMRINPSYRDLELPRDEWPLLDDYVPVTENECLKQNPTVYFTQLASPVSTLRTIVDALIDAWPNVQTRCDYDTATLTYKLGRKDRQNYGTRFMLGLISLGDADRFGMRSAALQTTKGRYVAPTEQSIAAAVGLMRQARRYAPFAVTQQDLVRAGDAYPGTMVVYTTAKLQNLAKAEAKQVASFVRIATTEGQVRGRGNGDLPGGYLPLRRTGVTAPLWRAAQQTAGAIEAQDGVPTAVPGTTPPPGAAVAPIPEVPAPPAGAPVKGAPNVPTTEDGTVPTAATTASSSAIGNALLPLLFLVGGLAVASSLVSQVLARRGAR